jgi:hypothetical protein
MKVPPFYSIKKSDRQVYHNNNRCTEGNNIEKENLRQGTDGRPLCDHCERLNREGK